MNSLQLLPASYFITCFFVFGLCVGSFLNVAILRGLKNEPMVFERSRCPKCQNQLKWYMNIPVLSFIFLRGKCGFCKEPISFQYPLVELICAACFVVSYFAFGMSLKAIFICIIFSLFILLSATDFKETVIIDIHAYILLAVGLLYSYFQLGEINLVQGLIGAGFGFIFFEILARSGYILAGSRMFGEGDSLIALGLGAIFGWGNLLILFAISVLIQSVSAFPILIAKAFKDKKKKLATSYLMVIIGIMATVLMNTISLFSNPIIYNATLIVVISSLIWSLKNITSEIRNKKLDDTKDDEEKFCLLPFGPALIFASVICIFYLPQIKSFILDFVR